MKHNSLQQLDLKIQPEASNVLRVMLKMIHWDLQPVVQPKTNNNKQCVTNCFDLVQRRNVLLPVPKYPQPNI